MGPSGAEDAASVYFGMKFGWTIAPSRVRHVAFTSSSSQLITSDLVALSIERFDEGVKVARVEGRGRGRNPRDVGIADDLDPVVAERHFA